MFLIKKRKTKAEDIYNAEIIEICSIEKPLSIKKPKRAVPNAVENTIKAVVNAFTGKTFVLFTRLYFDNCEIYIEENWHDC